MNVLEISSGMAAGYAGLLLAQLGHPVRRLGVEDPLRQPASAAEVAARQAFLHQDKQSVETLPDLSEVDVIIEDVGRRALRRLGTSRRALRRGHANMILISLSPFGLSGPYRDWQAVDLNVQAVGGVMHVAGYDREAPLKLPGDTAAAIAGIHGATAAATAFFGVQSGNEAAVHIDISAQDTLMQHWTRHISQYAYSGTLMRREPRRPRGIGARHTAKAKDGWVYMLALRVPWQEIARFLGLSRFITSEYETADHADQPWDAMERAFHDRVAEKERYRWFAEAAELGWTFAPVDEPSAIRASPQNRSRGLFRKRALPMAKTSAAEIPAEIDVVGMPYRISHSVDAAAAPPSTSRPTPTSRN